MPSRDTSHTSELFIYNRTIRFHETDAAGVVYFANILTLCHEAYEASLASQEIDLRGFFRAESLAVPIVHASVDFRQPMYCGDQVAIVPTPHLINDSTFEIRYHLSKSSQKPVATALTRHVCIDSASRQRRSLSPELLAWLQSTRPAPEPD